MTTWDGGGTWDSGLLWGPFGTLGASVNGFWSTWIPNQGPIGLQLQTGDAINSLWFPQPQAPVTVTANNAVMYTVASNLAEVVRVNASTSLVTISGTSSTLMYVYATSDRFRPFKEST